MPYLLKRSRQVLIDIKEALTYYQEISPELGEKFDLELFRTVGKIQRNPHHYFKLTDKIRRANLRTFPYKLIYKLDEETVIIRLGRLLHHHKNPAILKRRLK